MDINFSNVEELIFYDKNVQRMLPDMKSIFQKWTMGKQVPKLKSMSQEAILEFFKVVSNQHISVLEEHFKEEVILHKFDSHIVRNCSCTLEESEEYLNMMEVVASNFAISRDESHLYLCTWG